MRGGGIMENQVLIIIFVGLVFFILSLLFLRKQTTNKLDKNTSLSVINANVESKNQSVDRSRDVNGKSTAVRFFVTFSKENGEIITLKVPYPKYLKLEKGVSGRLKYKEDCFISFINN